MTIVGNKAQYKSNTNGIEVAVIPQYVSSQISKEEGSFFSWDYHVEIINKSDETIQLINRYWRVIDEVGEMQEIKGLGIVGDQPILAPNDNFKYSSGINLRYPSGIMSGSYGIKKSNGEIISVAIPAFSLDVPSLKHTIH